MRPATEVMDRITMVKDARVTALRLGVDVSNFDLMLLVLAWVMGAEQ